MALASRVLPAFPYCDRERGQVNARKASRRARVPSIRAAQTRGAPMPKELSVAVVAALGARLQSPSRARARGLSSLQPIQLISPRALTRSLRLVARRR